MISQTKSRLIPTRIALIFWCVFIGVGAVFGATSMITDPTGKSLQMDLMLPYFQKLPFADILFQDYLFSGFALLIVNGISNLIAAVLLFARKKSGIVLGTTFGITLMLWICIQFYMFPANPLSISYFIFGFLQAITGYMAYVFYCQETFVCNEADYTKIGTDSKKLVVYFSRLGYTKKIALEEANNSGSKVLELHAKEPTQGTLGFWWCGRFGMHRWEMPIEEINEDLSQYDEVTICTPIWVFDISAPIRAFCALYANKLKNVRYVFVHHTNSSYEKCAIELDKILNVEHSSFKSITCKKGNYTKEVSYFV